MDIFNRKPLSYASTRDMPAPKWVHNLPREDRRIGYIRHILESLPPEPNRGKSKTPEALALSAIRAIMQENR